MPAASRRCLQCFRQLLGLFGAPPRSPPFSLPPTRRSLSANAAQCQGVDSARAWRWRACGCGGGALALVAEVAAVMRFREVGEMTAVVRSSEVTADDSEAEAQSQARGFPTVEATVAFPIARASTD